MKLHTALALAIAAVAVGVPVATATPDGYQPQLKGGQSDAFDRYVRNNAPTTQPDAFERYLKNNPSPSVGTGAAAFHPDSRAVRPSVPPHSQSIADDGVGFSWESGIVGALGGGLMVVLAFAGASAMRERRRLVLR